MAALVRRSVGGERRARPHARGVAGTGQDAPSVARAAGVSGGARRQAGASHQPMSRRRAPDSAAKPHGVWLCARGGASPRLGGRARCRPGVIRRAFEQRTDRPRAPLRQPGLQLALLRRIAERVAAMVRSSVLRKPAQRAPPPRPGTRSRPGALAIAPRGPDKRRLRRWGRTGRSAAGDDRPPRSAETAHRSVRGPRGLAAGRERP